MSGILEKLNLPQQEAVRTTEGPVLILAGAGSGKTRAITHRIAWLIEEKGVEPWNILAITFTNKAAEEMRERVTALTEQGSSVFVATFHATCVRILRSAADCLGYGRDFTIYDADDSRVLMRQIIKSMNLDSKVYPEKEVLRQISSLKDELITPEQYESTAAGHFRERKIAELYREYQKRLMLANAMDFDDLLLNTVLLFREYEDVLERYRRRFRYIMVDEYQDTNTAQFAFVELLAREHRNLCVVGDDDQSIYKFRGANIQNILNFEESFPGAKVIRLEQNYRSTRNILAAANQVIANNSARKDKQLWSDKPEGDKVVFRQYPDAYEEARGIVKDLEKDRNRYPYGSCAVLYRTNAQSRVLEEKFVEWGVPYRLIGGTNYYERREVKDILAYMKTVANGQDDLAVRRIINVPRRGIGDSSVEKIAELASREGLSFYEALKLAADSPELKRASAKLKAFEALIEDLREDARSLRIWELIERILNKTGYREALKEEGEVEAEARLENILELENKAAGLKDEPGDPEALSGFLEEVALVADVDNLVPEEERVVLMTLHSAKGLEFPKVYIAGMEQDIFPSSRALYSGDPTDLEEERRLCYVGFTRAKEKLILTAARLRMVNGQTQVHTVSQFVEEVDPAVLKREGAGFMETREQYQSRRARKDYEAGYGDGEPISRFGRQGTPTGWTDFGDSFGFAAAGRPVPGEGYGRPKAKSGGEAEGESLSSYFSQKKSELEARTAEAGTLKPGDRVKQKRFGEGTVVQVEQGKKDLEVTVDFDNYGRKVMMAGFAGFTKL